MDAPVIFFDGECVLCNHFARFVLRRDVSGCFRLASLQGETARQMLGGQRTTHPDSILIATPRDIITRSDAVVFVLTHLGGVLRVLGIVSKLIPRILRDWIYDQVARRRFVFFGRTTELCGLLPPEQRRHILP